MATLRTVMTLLVIGFFLWLLVPKAAMAESWVMVAKSDQTLERQYVDVDSIQVVEQAEGQPTYIRLKTSWGFQDDPNSLNVATTEYLCQKSQYRDVVVNDKTTGDSWHSVGKDTLNRAAMDYGCSRENH
ncbi:MAG: hypothetical protein WBA57_25925 [Elainellaceae cyanobacterium]